MNHTVPNAAKKLGVSASLVWKLIYSGQLPFLRINTSVLVRDEDVDAFIEANIHRHQPKQSKPIGGSGNGQR